MTFFNSQISQNFTNTPPSFIFRKSVTRLLVLPQLITLKTLFKILIFISLINSSHCIELTEIQFLSEPSIATTSVDMTDDMSRFVAGSSSNSSYIYAKINESYSLHQKINSSGIEYVDITGDGHWLLTIDNDGNGLVYKLNNKTGNFSLFQTFILGSESPYAGALTDNHQMLVLSDKNQIFIYKFNGA